MPFFKQFFKSLYSPKYIAAFRFQGIGKTIQHLFILALIMCFPTIFYTTLHFAGNNASEKFVIEKKLPILGMFNDFFSENGFILIPVVFLMYFLFLTFLLFLKASIFACIGLILLALAKKRGEFRHLFRVSAYALTLPALITIILELFNFTLPFHYLVDWVLTSIMLVLSIRFFPGFPK